jgi:hypothetical protein
MMAKYELSENKARELVKAWTGHVENDTHCEQCADVGTRCPINTFFKKLDKKFGKAKK